MNEYTKKTIKLICAAVLAVVFILITAYGQRTVSYFNLAIMLFGLSGILVLVYLYNRSYTQEPKADKSLDKEKNKEEKEKTDGYKK